MKIDNNDRKTLIKNVPYGTVVELKKSNDILSLHGYYMVVNSIEFTESEVAIVNLESGKMTIVHPEHHVFIHTDAKLVL